MKLFSFRLAILILVVVALLSLANAATVATINVDGNGENTLMVNLNSGERLSCTITIVVRYNASADPTIDFWMTNPTGTPLMMPTGLWGGRTYMFTADIDGAYTLHFGNTFSNYSKNVTVSYDVAPPLIFGLEPPFFYTVAFAGVVVIALVLLLEIRHTVRRRRNARKNEDNAP
jgi:hypothetical protein